MIADDMAELVKLFETSDLTELSIEQHGRKLFLRKGEQLQPDVQEQQEEPATSTVVEVKAHLVGVFHWSRDKSAKQGMTLQQEVEKGQVVGYIEALGILNEVEVPESGQVVEITIAAGQPVEYGQPLLLLIPGS